MSDLDALLAGIVADSHNQLRWLIVADWLDDHGQPERAELLRLHRMLIDTCLEPDAHPERAEWQARIVELIDQGVTPCVPQHTLMLPRGIPLVGNFIPPRSFLMGGKSEGEQPIHKVTLANGFFMGIYPVSQQQWRVIMGTNPSNFKGHLRPVELVDRIAATAYCEMLSRQASVTVRLPTEAEWEYACRAGTTTHFHYGDTPDPARMKCKWDGRRSSGPGSARQDQTTEVGEFAPNPWGLFDCHGNVGEWCVDDSDPTYSEVDPVAIRNPETTFASLGVRFRGGSWNDDPKASRAASRGFHVGFGREGHCRIGFRVAFTLS